MYLITEFVLNLDGLSPTQKAVLHSLAFHANKDGGNSYPSMGRIAREAGLKHRRSAQRVMRQLEKKGIVVPETPKTGGSEVTTKYRFNLEYHEPAVALSDEQTAVVEPSKQRPSGPQDQETATIRSPIWASLSKNQSILPPAQQSSLHVCIISRRMTKGNKAGCGETLYEF